MPRIQITELKIDHSNAVARLRAIDGEAAMLQDQITRLKHEAREIANAEAQKIAGLQIGQEVDCEYGYNHKTKRYRVAAITGQFWDYEGLARFNVTYRGVLLKKDGGEGESTNLYNIVKVYPFEGTNEKESTL